MALTADEQAELQQLQNEYQTQQVATAPATGLSPDEAAELKQLQGEYAAAQPAQQPVSDAELAKRNWQNARNPWDRLQAMFLATPTYAKQPLNQAANLGIRASGPAIGQAVGAATGPFAEVGVPVGGAIGGMVGEIGAEAREGQGFKIGRILGAGATGAIPGSPLAKAGAAQVAKTAAGYAAGNVAGKTIETMADEGRLPTAGEATLAATGGVAGAVLGKYLDKGTRAASIAEQKGVNELRDETLNDGLKAGYVVPPSAVNPGATANTLESIAGKAAMKQNAAIHNQGVTNSLVKTELGLPQSEPITTDALDALRLRAAAPYREVQQIATQAQGDLDALLQQTQDASMHQTAANRASPMTAKQIQSLQTLAGADVEGWREANFEANANYRYYQRSADPEALSKAQAAEKRASDISQKIEAAAIEANRPDLAAQLQQSRQFIAKTYDVENALNLATGDVSAAKLGQAYRNGKKLSGNLAVIAKMQQAFKPFMGDAVSTPTPGVSKLKGIGGLITTTLGHETLGVPGAIIGAALPFSSDLVRSGLLSRPGQAMLARPQYPVPLPDFSAQIGNFGSLSLARNPTLAQYLTPQGQP